MTTRQHRLPASVIGGFSNSNQTASRRLRKVWVARRSSLEVVRRPAERLGRDFGAYTFTDIVEFGDLLDDSWEYFESELVQVLDDLASSATSRTVLDARTLLRVLVPYVGATLVRGRHFDSRFEKGLEDLGVSASDLTADNTNIFRVRDLPRFCSLLLQCRWMFCRAPSDSKFLLNDLGYTMHGTGESPEGTDGALALHVPLKPDLLLVVTRQQPPVWTRGRRGYGVVNCRFGTVTRDLVKEVNRAAAAYAYDEIYCGDKGEAQTYRPSAGRPTYISPVLAIMSQHETRVSMVDGLWLYELNYAGLDWPALPSYRWSPVLGWGPDDPDFLPK